MKKGIETFTDYLCAVLGETYNRLSLFIEIPAFVITFSPVDLSNVVFTDYQTRLIGLFLFVFSFGMANYRVFVKLSERVSDGADIFSEVLTTKILPSDGVFRVPFENFPHHGNGYAENGMPDCAIMRTFITLTNRGKKHGKLLWLSEGTKITLDAIFDKGQSKFSFVSNDSIPGESAERVCLNGYLLITEKDPIVFARRLNKLGKKNYKIVIRYWTSRIDGIKKHRKIEIVGTYESFIKDVHQRWEDFGPDNLKGIHGQ